MTFLNIPHIPLCSNNTTEITMSNLTCNLCGLSCFFFPMSSLKVRAKTLVIQTFSIHHLNIQPDFKRNVNTTVSVA